MLGGKAPDTATARRLCEETLKSGKPRELFLQNVKSQGGNPDALLAARGTYRSPVSAEIYAAQDGYVSRVDAWKVGHAGVFLGVGRNRTEDNVCPTAGIQFHLKRGCAVKSGDKLMTVWAANEAGLNIAIPQLTQAVEYSQVPPAPRKLILKEIH
jgi:pyrimidine-nucleoside phosphorylase